jgi:hypothetical protein
VSLGLLVVIVAAGVSLLSLAWQLQFRPYQIDYNGNGTLPKLVAFLGGVLVLGGLIALGYENGYRAGLAVQQTPQNLRIVPTAPGENPPPGAPVLR